MSEVNAIAADAAAPASSADKAAFLQRLLRGAGNLPATRFEIFQRVYVRGQTEVQAASEMGLDVNVFESERRAAVRTLMFMR